MKHKALAAMGATVSAAVIAIAGASPAMARPIEHQHFSDSGSAIAQEQFPGFCAGVVDFPVLHEWQVEGMFLIRPLGDGLPYAVNPFRVTDTWTNTLNGKTFTVTRVVQEKDQTITDNGDGTFTIVNSSTGVSKVYGPDGTRLFMDTGTLRAEILVDNGGTPADPSDDQFLDFIRVIADPGQADTQDRDFCADLVTFIG
ncbi:hypothetical protein [Arthrobacter sp. M4]|uniref:hypothetical protein n=1 Tax=Arthrobacter sp. M4 TaxID=218160 RepID=UPI001CDC4D98|nr:hypothetical protein [Arthrobacter sp. M4]MCA4135715.1 hypothetical protein [Arthrobacter sp. M4]